MKQYVTNLTVKPLCTTRWESRVESVKAVRYQIKGVYVALIAMFESELGEAGPRHEAKSLATELTRFEFLVSLVVWYDLLFQVNIVSKSRQSKTMDIAAATESIEKCVQFVSEYREKGFYSAIITAKDLAETLDTNACFRDLVH